jgi:phosphatidylglycerol:prolipoprotein diacylglycerol transferase
MPPILLHIYGPIAIHSFGAMIVLGLIITLCLLHRDKPLQKLISDQQLATIFQLSFVTGITGGRIWFLITNPSMIEHWTDCFTVWAGGLSILGAVIGIVSTLLIYFNYTKLPALPILDRIALYTPLLQAISRFGCFFAGCCFGKPTDLPWGVVYENYDSLAPLDIVLHPTQIYSSLFLLCNFIILLCFDRYYHTSHFAKSYKDKKKPGQILTLYIMLISLERFSVDFLRGDQEFFTQPGIFGSLSMQQALALCLFLGALSMFTFISMYKKSDESI